MNEKFFALPEEKQHTIINAGFRVFSQNSYKKSPVREIAEAAGISKSLLFHYFHNKKELYLFLWDYCAKMTLEYLDKYQCYAETDLFEIMYRGLQAKTALIRQYPDMALFSMKAYYEKDPEVCGEIQKSIEEHGSYSTQANMLKLDPKDFVPGLDLQCMYQDMFWASEGYLWEKMQNGTFDVDKMEEEYRKMIDFWKSIYLRKEN